MLSIPKIVLVHFHQSLQECTRTFPGTTNWPQKAKY